MRGFVLYKKNLVLCFILCFIREKRIQFCIFVRCGFAYNYVRLINIFNILNSFMFKNIADIKRNITATILCRYQAETDLRLNGQRTPSSPGSQASQVYLEHSYSLPPALPERTEPMIRVPPASVKVKHTKIVKLTKAKEKDKDKEKIHKVEKRKSNKSTKTYSNSQNHEGEKENIQNDYVYEKLSKQVPQSLVTYKERDLMSEMAVLYEFLTRGIDMEDVEYLRRSYEALLADDSQGYWLNDTHWVDHPPTDVPSPAKKRKRDELRLHASGSARTEGYYKVDVREKAKHKVIKYKYLS